MSEITGERKVRISVELMDTLCIRDARGYRLRVEWGEPDADGIYCPTVHVDFSDNPFDADRKVLEQHLATTAKDLGNYASGLRLDAEAGVVGSNQLNAIAGWMERLAAALAPNGKRP